METDFTSLSDDELVSRVENFIEHMDPGHPLNKIQAGHMVESLASRAGSVNRGDEATDEMVSRLERNAWTMAALCRWGMEPAERSDYEVAA